MEQKTPARGTSFGQSRIGIGATGNRIPMAGSGAISSARTVAQAVVAILPEDFAKVLPRGYTLAGTTLLMAHFESIDNRGQVLYARHPNWSEKEARVFLHDLKDGWLDEVAAFMRWQLRNEPIQNAVFQHALVHLKDDAMRRVLISR